MSTSESGVHTFGKRNKHLLKTGAYSDFTIECGGRQFEVHRSIVCPQSQFLEILCDSNFEEGITKRASLKETDSEIFQKTLDFLYTGTYDDGSFASRELPTVMAQVDEDTTCDSPTPVTVDQDMEDHVCNVRSFEGSALLLNVQLYILSEFLQVQQLKEESLKRCKKLMEKRFDAANFVDGIEKALSHVNEQDHKLRAQIFRSCVENWQKVANCPALDDLLMEYQPIAWMVLKEKMAELEKGRDEQTLNVRRLTEQVGTLQVEVSIVKDELAQAHKLVGDHRNCRNCGQEFGGYLEKHYYGKIMLRCSKCRCRHE